MAEPPSVRRAPARADEEIVYADKRSVVSERSEAERLRLRERELVFGLRELGKIGPAICVFGSARTPAEAPDYDRARRLGRAIVEAGFAVITGGGPEWVAGNESPRRSREGRPPGATRRPEGLGVVSPWCVGFRTATRCLVRWPI
jgi:hypothetical protein